MKGLTGLTLLLLLPFGGPGGFAGTRPISLPEALSLAEKNSAALTALKTKIQSSERIIHERWRDFLPDATLRYQKQDTVSIREEDSRYQSAQLELGYDIHTSGRTFALYRIARIAADISRTEFTIERSNLRLDVKKQYYGLLRSRGEEEIYRQLLESLELQKRIIAEEVRLGTATELQKIQVEARIYEARYGILRSKNDYNEGIKRFLILLGLSQDDSRELSPPKEGLPDPEEISTDIPGTTRRAYLLRGDFRRLGLLMNRTREEAKLARHYYMPRVRLTGSYGYMGTDVPMNRRIWSVGISVTASLFGSSAGAGQTLGEKESGHTRFTEREASVSLYDDPSFRRVLMEAAAAYREASLSHQLMKKSIAVEIERDCRRIREIRLSLEAAKSNVEMLRRQLAIENEKARLGDIARYEVLKTCIELSQARLRLLSSQIEYRIAAAVLEKAAGIDMTGGHGVRR